MNIINMLFSCSVMSDSLQSHGLHAACQAFLSFTIPWSLLKLISIESVMPSNHLILCHPLFLLPSIFPSNRVFSNELALCIRWPSIGASASASASVLPMNIQDWFPLGLTGLIIYHIVITKWMVLLRTDFTISHHLDYKVVFQEALFTRDLTRGYKLTSEVFLKAVL